MYPRGEMVEAHAELVDVELASDTETVSECYLVVIGQMLVNLSDIFAWWEVVVDASLQLAIVTIII